MSRTINTLQDAAAEGTQEDVWFLIGAGEKVNSCDLYGRFPLSVAASYGNTAVARALMEFEADPDQVDYEGETAVDKAIYGGHAETLLALLNYGTDEERKQRSIMALHRASEEGNAVLVETLLDYGVNIEAADAEGRTALLYAVPDCRYDPRRDHDKYRDVLRLLLDRGADVTVRAKGVTAIYGATITQDLDMVKMLQDAGAKLGLVEAAMIGATETVRHLLDLGEYINIVDIHGSTALHYAAARGYLETVHILLEYGADFTIKSDLDKTALYVAAEANQIATANMIIGYSAKANRDEINPSNFLAALLGYSDDINEPGQANDRPLMMIVGGDTPFLVQLFIQAGADVNAKNDYGYTVLMHAVQGRSTHVIQVLLDAGATVHGRNVDDKTALDYAIAYEEDEIITLLKAAGATE